MDGFSPSNRSGESNTRDNKDKLKHAVKNDIERGKRMKAGKKSEQDRMDDKALSWFDE
jgi:hypothetical protein